MAIEKEAYYIPATTGLLNAKMEEYLVEYLKIMKHISYLVIFAGRL
jgi:hypothetical protein